MSPTEMDLLRYAFEELKEIHDNLDAGARHLSTYHRSGSSDRMHELISWIGEVLGEFAQEGAQ